MGRCVPLFLALVAPTCADAQSLADLSNQLRPGDTVYVSEASRQTQGRFIEISPTALAVSIDGRRRDVALASVTHVERERAATKKGTLIGVLAGMGVAVWCGVHERHCGFGSNCESASCIAGAALGGTAIGLGGGAAVGGLIGARMKHRETVFVAPGRTALAGWSLVPIVGPSRNAVLLSLQL